MNELSKLFEQVKCGEQVCLENKIYHVRQDDSFHLTGYFCSNTTSYEENPQGERFTAIFLKDKDNVVIDGNGATLMIHGKMTPFVFDGCKNITLKNLTIDYARPTMNEFTVESVCNDTAILKINDEYTYEIVDGILYWLGEKDLNGEYYWRYPYRGKKIFAMQQTLANNHNHYCPDGGNGLFPSVPEYKKIEVLDKNTVKVTYEGECPLLADTVYQTRCVVRDQIGGFSQRCESLVFEDLTILAMHGFGVLSQFCENVTVRNVTAVPKKGRTITSNADFFQFSGCKGEILIENCVMSAGQDDFINLHGTYLEIAGYDEAENALTVEFKHPETWGFAPFIAGDTIEIVCGETLLMKEENAVKAVEQISPFAFKLFLLKKPTEIKLKDGVENATWNPSLTVRNCRFYESMAHAILCTTRGQVCVENCSFENLGCDAIAIGGGMYFWYESGKIADYVVKNCFFKDVGYGPGGREFPYVYVKPVAKKFVQNEYYHGKLTLENNVFENNEDKTHIYLRNIKEVVLKNNKFLREAKITCEHVGELRNEIE